MILGHEIDRHRLVEPPEGALLGGTAGARPFADPARTAEITTPWVTYPGLVEAECVSEGGSRTCP